MSSSNSIGKAVAAALAMASLGVAATPGRAQEAAGAAAPPAAANQQTQTTLQEVVVTCDRTSGKRPERSVQHIGCELSYHNQVQNSGGPDLVSYQAFGVGSGETSAQSPEAFHSTVDLTTLETTSQLGFATLTDSTSHFDTRAAGANDFTGFYYSFPFYTAVYGNSPRPLFVGTDTYDSNGWVEELRLASPSDGTFQWVADAFYERMRIDTDTSTG